MARALLDALRAAAAALLKLGQFVSPALTQGPANGTSGELFVGEPASKRDNRRRFHPVRRGVGESFAHRVPPQTNQERQSYLWPGDTTVVRGAPSIYEYNGNGPDRTQANRGEQRGTLTSDTDAHLIGNCGDDVGGGTFAGSSTGDKYNAVSTSGNRCFYCIQSRRSRCHVYVCGTCPE